MNNLTNIVLILLFFFTKKKTFFKKFFGLQVGLGWPSKNTGQVMGQPVFTLGKKKKKGSGQVFFKSS